MKLIPLAIFFVVAIYMCGCSSSPSTEWIHIYNPGKDALTITIDSVTVRTPPELVKPYELKTGKHLFQYHTMKDSFLVYRERKLLINPLQDTLYKTELLYQRETYKNDEAMKKIIIHLPVLLN